MGIGRPGQHDVDFQNCAHQALCWRGSPVKLTVFVQGPRDYASRTRTGFDRRRIIADGNDIDAAEGNRGWKDATCSVC